MFYNIFLCIFYFRIMLILVNFVFLLQTFNFYTVMKKIIIILKVINEILKILFPIFSKKKNPDNSDSDTLDRTIK